MLQHQSLRGDTLDLLSIMFKDLILGQSDGLRHRLVHQLLNRADSKPLKDLLSVLRVITQVPRGE